MNSRSGRAAFTLTFFKPAGRQPDQTNADCKGRLGTRHRHPKVVPYPAQTRWEPIFLPIIFLPHFRPYDFVISPPRSPISA